MTKQTEALTLALEALNRGESQLRWVAIAAIEEALAQPEQITEKEKISREMTAEIVAMRSLAEQEPLTDDRVDLIAHNTDPGDWNSLYYQDCWHLGFKAGFREAENEHKIKGSQK